MKISHFGSTVISVVLLVSSALVAGSDSELIAKFEVDDCRRFFNEQEMSSELIAAGPRRAFFGERPLQVSCEWQNADGTRFETHFGTWRGTFELAALVSLVFLTFFSFLADVLRAIARRVVKKHVRVLALLSYALNAVGVGFGVYWFLDISGVLFQ